MFNKMMIATIFGMFISLGLPQGVIAGESDITTNSDKKEWTETGTIDVEAKSLKLILGGTRGHGVLHFKGNDYTFKLSGKSLGGAGYTKSIATGIVYNLENVEDFAGNYSGLGAGIVIGKGKGGSSWESVKGVGLKMHAKSAEGVALNMGLNTVTVEDVELVKK
jgi:hypothetical protein